MKHLILNLLNDRFFTILIKWKKKLFPRHYYKSYSQDGEDMLLRKIFTGKRKGFFVDVGAHHPYKYSNTYFFYKLGWHGINIDANPKNMDLFKRKRKRDINLGVGISQINQELNFYSFEESALSSFDEALSKTRIEIEKYKLDEIIIIQTQRLEDILEKYIIGGKKDIDFMSIDVEGLEIEVLKSNDWTKFRPKYLLIEILNLDLENPKTNATYNYIRSLGFIFQARTFNTCLFKDIN